ncbi:hypothetical protein U1Q18_019988 [Sarracenia purpurea var. burkii]
MKTDHWVRFAVGGVVDRQDLRAVISILAENREAQFCRGRWIDLRGLYSTPAAPSHRLPVIHPQEFAPISSGQSPFVSDEHLAYTARDRILAVHSNVFFSRGESSPSSSFVHLQEVPSSYSSVTGNNSLDIYFAIEALLRAASI